LQILPQSVESSQEFEIRTELEKCWNFFLDLRNIGLCIPGCESVILLDSGIAQLKIKLKVGYLSRTFEIKAKLNEVQRPSRISFSGEGPDAEISGALDFSSGEGSVKVKYGIEIKPSSVIGKTAVTMMGKDLVRKQASQFASCVKAKLEG
jgi:carbon monoxide dehydrogenase subunit G